MEFSVPYNGDASLIPQLIDLRDKEGVPIREIFLSGPQENASSGRVVHNGNVSQFYAVVERMHAAGFRVNLVMNSTCEGLTTYSDEYGEYLRNYVGYMIDDLGIEAFTVANPYVLAIVREAAPNAEISASVLADVDCVERAQAFKRLGATVVTPDVSINRDMRMLKRIKEESGLELKVMVNEGCLHKCPYRKYHFNVMSHVSSNVARVGRGLSMGQFQSQINYVAGQSFFNMCGADLKEDPSQILKSGWVRPEDLHAYSDVATFFKISGRTRPTHVIVRMIRAYANQRWDGDLLDLMDSSLHTHSMATGACLNNKMLGEENFIGHVLNCNHHCAQCGFCERLAKKAVSYGELTELKKRDLSFFEEE